MIWRLLTVAFGTAVVALTVVVVWQVAERVRWRRRFARILDLDEEVATRRRDCDAEVAGRLAELDAEIARRRIAFDAEIAAQTAEHELARRDAALELAGTLRKITELEDRHTRSQLAYDRLRAELSVFEQACDDLSFGLYQPIFDFATPDDYKHRLLEVRDRQHAMVRDDQAVHGAVAGSVADRRKDGEQLQRQVAKLLVRAFNAECDAVAARVSWNNASRMIERVKHAFDAINKLGSVVQLELAGPYRELKLEELKLEYELAQNRRDQQEDQRVIRELQREEDHVRQQLERVCKEAEAEEARWQRALDPAYRDLANAQGAAVKPLRANIAIIESELRDARQRRERAILRAEKTGAGHVYILSNVGSFGDTVYKIGMTRRDNPMEAVRELDAVVPFDFDVHAMIPSEDAPALHGLLHRQFHHRRINAVDLRREYFQVTLDEIEAFARSAGIAIQLTRGAEARQYRETFELRREASERAGPRPVHGTNGFGFPAAV
jgi:hypothetical protein